MDQAIQSAIKGSSETGDHVATAMIVMLGVIYLLVELLKFFGFQKRREKGSGSSEEVCKWIEEDHRWLMEMRDLAKDIQREQGVFIGVSRQIADSVERMNQNLQRFADDLKDETSKLQELILRMRFKDRDRGN